MTRLTLESPSIPADLYRRALGARDARFDGLFFVGITTTRVYCRPVCPSRAAADRHRRFFESQASAERAGFRPCLRCRPELSPGKAPVDAVPRLATVAAQRIAAGALNGHGVAELAQALGVSERHLRRALERELGVSPLELAQTHRLLLAKRLLADTALPVTQVAFAAGFQSLRRFNTAFRDRYRMRPSDVRRAPRKSSGDLVRLTLAYRPPFAWDALTELLRRDALPGVETVRGDRYARTVRMGDARGVIVAQDSGNTHLTVDVSPSLLPGLMPLLARLRQLFDLDAEPAAIDAHLAQGGLGDLVAKRPGLRIPGALDGFEVALGELLRAAGRRHGDLLRRVVADLGEPIETEVPGLDRLAPTPERVVEAGVPGLAASGVPRRTAAALHAAAVAWSRGAVPLEPGSDAAAARRSLTAIDGIGPTLATTVVMRALGWPDAFPVGARDAAGLRARAEAWRPWRAYASLYLRLFAPHDLGQTLLVRHNRR